MPNIKTPEQIQAEVAALHAVKPKVRLRNYFGDDLHAQIDAQIHVLTEDLDESDIYDEWEDPDDPESNRGLIDAGLDALAWRDGWERPDAEHDSLAKGWEDIGLGNK